MKKRTLGIAAGVMALVLCLCAAAGEGAAVQAPSVWADAADPLITAELWPAEAGGELALDLHRPQPDGTRTDYRMRLESVVSDGTAAVYSARGEIVRVTGDGSGAVVREDWENREVRGTVTFSPGLDGRMCLTMTDVMAPELDTLCLVMTETPAPPAEEIAREALLPLLETETGTAGAGLKKAQTAAALIRYAVRNRLFAANAEELEARVKEALEGAARTPERREAFRAVAEDVFALARAFAGMDGADAREAARLLMEDAGAAEETERNLRRAVDRLSVEALFEAFGIRTGD